MATENSRFVIAYRRGIQLQRTRIERSGGYGFAPRDSEKYKT